MASPVQRRISSTKEIVEQGMQSGKWKLWRENKNWSRYSKDKVDIGEELIKVVRTLLKELPLRHVMKAFSIGSGDEPQFRILESVFRGGLYLLDIDQRSLDIVQERISRQSLDHVTTIQGDYNKILLKDNTTEAFLKKHLGGDKLDLITLHHSLYYCAEETWETIFANLYRKLLRKVSAIHSILMASESENEYTTTWLYNYFAGKFFGVKNNQSLLAFAKKLKKNSTFRNTQIYTKTHCVQFRPDNFEEFMAVVWMILLYPEKHDYSFRQRKEITEFVYKKFWITGKSLLQYQDHLVIYRGVKLKGLV